MFGRLGQGRQGRRLEPLEVLEQPLHLGRIGARLTELSVDQAAYLGVPVEGPYKEDSYRY